MTNVVNEYGSSNQYARVPEVLDLMRVMSKQMELEFSATFTDVFNTVFYETLEMIKDDFRSFLPFRLPFY